MSSRTQSLYDVLGVDEKASDKDIQKAFRRLARSLHPDINKAEDADVKFQEVQEAYEVLSDKAYRSEYDERLKSGNKSFDRASFEDVFGMFFGNKRGTNNPIHGKNIFVTVPVTAEEILRGASKMIEIKKDVTCSDCEGVGSKRSREHCNCCDGKGGEDVVTRTPFGKLQTFKKCEECKGTGKRSSIPCDRCSEKGVIYNKKDFAFKIPKTLKFDDEIVFEGEGNSGKDGGRTGNLYIKVEQSSYDKVKVNFFVDLNETKSVPLKTLLSGEKYTVVFPDGTSDEVDISVNANDENAMNMSFPDKGLHDENGNRGLYNLRLIIGIPELSLAQKKTILMVLEGN